MEKTIINVETGETITREFNEEELKQLEIDNAEIKARKAQIEAKAKVKAEILDKLGISEQEAKLLLS